MNATNPSPPIANPASTAGDVHPSVDPSMSANVSPARNTAAIAAPGRSMWRTASSSRDSGTFGSATRKTKTAIGRFRKKMPRHEMASTISPPASGPMAAPIPESDAHRPIARPRSDGSNDAVRIARLLGTRSAPPMPWMPRATSSSTASGPARTTSSRS